jgi:sulfur carrier protein
MINIIVNATERTCFPNLTVTAFLETLILQPGMVAVEKNGRIIPKEDYGQETVNEGDSFEIIKFMGGG